MQIAASDRADTVVEVRPTDPADQSDVEAAQQVRVDFSNGTLRVTGPKRTFDFSRKTRSADVSIQLPSGSRVTGGVQAGDVSATGDLGECRFKAAAGNVRVERTGPLRVHTSAGHVTAETVTGNADLSTGSGRIRVGAIEGNAVVKNSNGETTIDAVTGDVRVRAANGEITVGRAGAGVDAKSSNGSIRLGEVVRGQVALGTSMGDLEIGIAEGTAAWLEVNTSFGHVRNLMENATRPGDADQTVEVRGTTSYGDITIHRS
ncbi:hypothetical protein Ari01nite_73370 [Paractinoplanes rishiriensis]|uniref:DUF4097 domain-containing protein n=1 Tax=Paractinoplanes rishiriensis TaxID=1050105 RepID=A0A919K5U1_9ACTN|nr:hypothetical protein Ari01nite_73370 [Actinoplanes rishiriensis]